MGEAISGSAFQCLSGPVEKGPACEAWLSPRKALSDAGTIWRAVKILGLKKNSNSLVSKNKLLGQKKFFPSFFLKSPEPFTRISSVGSVPEKPTIISEIHDKKNLPYETDVWDGWPIVTITVKGASKFGRAAETWVPAGRRIGEWERWSAAPLVCTS